jgi:beta-lactamase superfamily II metal-dependent hydrolase
MSHRLCTIGSLVALSVSVACSGALVDPPTAAPPLSANNTIVPGAQALVINEVMADPNAVTDANGEWFELYNPGSAAINIQGYQIASANDAGFTVASSVSVPAGGYVVLARIAASGTNGGVTVAYAYGTAINLANTTDWLSLRDASGSTIDSVAWSTTTAGKSWSLKNPGVAHSNIVAGTVWQLATSTYGLGDSGTPRLQNDGFTSGGGGGGTYAELVVRVLDVGQGDANYISNGTSKVIIDGGPSATRFGVLLDSLGLNNTTINAVILSHQHADHLAGLQELFKTSRHITIGYFFENKDVYTSTGLATLRDSINARVSRAQLIYRDTDDPCANGQAMCDLALNGGAKMHIMRPKPSDANPNNRSVPVKLIGPDSASFTMWMAGDAEQEAIAWFLTTAGYATNPGMKVNVLKADHHGSCNGLTNAYLNAVNPQYVTASVAASNSFKHMNTQAKTMYSAHGKPWYRTDQNGTIVFRTPGSPGGGYTVSVLKGTTNMSGPSDAASVAAECNPIP